MKLEISQIPCHADQMHLILCDQGSCIEYRGVSYYSLDDFLADYPDFISADDIPILASASNFFFGGLQYALIDDTASYREKYQNRMDAEISERIPKAFGISQYGAYNVSIIKPPQLVGHVLTFFVESANFGIPYQVRCELPLDNKPSSCTYSLLPYRINE